MYAAICTVASVIGGITGYLIGMLFFEAVGLAILDFYDAPELIDYMSIDTEGSEFDIIKKFDFSKRKIKIISIEHNYHPKNRKNIYKKLTSEGYKRIFEDISKFDDWYILN